MFELDASTSSWVEIKKIGNLVLFLRNRSTSFSAAGLRCKENLIYFIGPKPLQQIDTLHVFDMDYGSIGTIESGLIYWDPYFHGGCYFGCEQMWVTPNFV